MWSSYFSLINAFQSVDTSTPSPGIDASVLIAIVSLIGVIATGVFTYFGNKQTRKENKETSAATMARGEIELALSSQREELDRLHTSYKAEIEYLLVSHSRKIEFLTSKYEVEIVELKAQLGSLESRAKRAEKRASISEEKAIESAEHAKRCDAALALLQADHDRLRQQIEGMTQ